MGFLAAIPAALGIGGGSAAAGGLTAAAGAGAATGASMGAGALGAGTAAAGTGAGLGAMGLGSTLGVMAPFAKSIADVASSGSKMLGALGDIPLSDVFGSLGKEAGAPASVPGTGGTSGLLSNISKGAQFGGSLSSLLGGGGAAPQMPQAPPMSPAQPMPLPAQPTSTGPGTAPYMPTAKLISQMLNRR